MVVRVRVRVRVRVIEMILHFLWLDYCHGKKSGMRKTKACLKHMFLNVSNLFHSQVKKSKVKVKVR